MPYVYLIDAGIRDEVDIICENAIIIFDEAHNVTTVAEEVSSFELRAKNLESTLTEIDELSDAIKKVKNADWRSSKQGLTYIKRFTQRFLEFLRNISLDIKHHPKAVQGASQNRYLPEKSIILPGKEIYNVFFEGTRTEEKMKNKQGEWEEMSLLKSWYAIRDHFENALQDISELESEKAKTKLQDWFDVLAKVMRLWQLG